MLSRANEMEQKEVNKILCLITDIKSTREISWLSLF